MGSGTYPCEIVGEPYQIYSKNQSVSVKKYHFEIEELPEGEKEYVI